ncbi:MAG TPA: hypothetical protein VM008_16935 [Phycisphaerae bacterium]|nr:hypothetical protein [Phycisphaerae bacterium]
MKLSSFIAGTFGIVGFVLSMVSGLIVDNPVTTIVYNALIWATICYVIGYIVGAVAQQVSSEHAAALAKRVADADAAKEAEQAEEQAKIAAEAAANAPNKGNGEPVLAGSAVPGKI